MKGNKKLFAIAVLLLLVVVSYTTYAIYRTSVSTNSEVTAAAWAVTFKNGQTELTSSQNLVLTCANNNHVKDGVIAPGATCTGTVTIDATGSDVDVAYTVARNGNDVLVDGNAVSEDANAFTVTITDNGNGTIAYNANPQTATVTVELAWGKVDDSDSQTDPNKTNDADTLMQGGAITVPITLTAKQVVD